MRLLLIVLLLSYIVNILAKPFLGNPFQGPGTWQNFWRPPATKTSIVMDKLYHTGGKFVRVIDSHTRVVWTGLWRMAYLMWLGICPYKISSTTAKTTTRRRRG